MSFDIFFQRFEGGEAASADSAEVLAILAPAIAERDNGWARIETFDGAADIYGLDEAVGLMVNHASGTAVWDLLYDVAHASCLAVMPTGSGGTYITDESLREHLPAGLPEPIVVVRSGSDLLDAITNA